MSDEEGRSSSPVFGGIERVELFKFGELMALNLYKFIVKILEKKYGESSENPRNRVPREGSKSKSSDFCGEAQKSRKQGRQADNRQVQRKSRQRNTWKGTERSTQESSERSSEDSPERSTGDSPEGSIQESPGRSAGVSPERGIEDSPERSTRESSEGNSEDSPERSARDSPEKDTEDSSERSTRESSEGSSEDSPERSIRDSPERGAEDSPERSTQESSERSSEDSPETSTEKSPERSARDNPERQPKRQLRDRASTSLGKRKMGGESSSSSRGAIQNFKLGERLKMYKALIGRIEEGLEAGSRSLSQQVMIRNQHQKIRSMFAQDGIDVASCNLNPVVVLKDIRRSSNNKLPLDIPPKSPPIARTTPNGSDDLSSSSDVATPRSSPPRSARSSRSARSAPSLSPSPSRLSGPSTSRGRSVKRKRSSEPSREYEIEAIVGYHRDKRSKMWYLIKWKDWDEKYNTFEPIENLTSCHYELMKYFEVLPPSQEDLKKKRKAVSRGMKQRSIYKKLVKYNYRANELEAFSRTCLDLSQLFEATDLSDLERHIREEYGYIIRCLIGMYNHQDYGLMQRAQNYKLFLKLIKVRRRQLQKISATEHRINSLEITPLKIENNVDMETFPNIEYIVQMKHMQGVQVPKAILGCDCTDCTPRSRCCGKLADSTFAYGSNARLRNADRIAIYECNTCCKCPPTCSNRVVQRGRQVRLCIFKTKTYGWGVKTLEKIPKGTFICQYIGEMIPDSEAVVRDVTYLQEKKSGYLFDLDFFADPKLEMFCIDATDCGNLARFINHSCEPNLAVYPVWIDNPAPNMHHLAFFAKRNIGKDEELNFDYENLEHKAKETGEAKPWAKMVADMRCQCKAANCREWVFGNK